MCRFHPQPNPALHELLRKSIWSRSVDIASPLLTPSRFLFDPLSNELNDIFSFPHSGVAFQLIEKGFLIGQGIKIPRFF